MAKGNGSTRSSTPSSARALSGPALWEARRAEAPSEISAALSEAGFKPDIQGNGSVSAYTHFYEGEHPVDIEMNIGLYNAEEKNYIVYGVKKKTLGRSQVTNNGGRGRIAIGVKEYTRTKKLNNLVSTLPEAIEAINKFSKKF